MSILRSTFAPLLLAGALLAQSPADRIHNGFHSLSTGGWADAFKEWQKQALPLAPVDPEPRPALEAWIPKTWDIGNWEQLKSIRFGRTWQRQWWIATFDRGVVYFCFDFAQHKGEWRLFRLSVSRDASALISEMQALQAGSHPE